MFVSDIVCTKIIVNIDAVKLGWSFFDAFIVPLYYKLYTLMLVKQLFYTFVKMQDSKRNGNRVCKRLVRLLKYSFLQSPVRVI